MTLNGKLDFFYSKWIVWLFFDHESLPEELNDTCISGSEEYSCLKWYYIKNIMKVQRFIRYHNLEFLSEKLIFILCKFLNNLTNNVHIFNFSINNYPTTGYGRNAFLMLHVFNMNGWRLLYTSVCLKFLMEILQNLKVRLLLKIQRTPWILSTVHWLNFNPMRSTKNGKNYN